MSQIESENFEFCLKRDMEITELCLKGSRFERPGRTSLPKHLLSTPPRVVNVLFSFYNPREPSMMSPTSSLVSNNSENVSIKLQLFISFSLIRFLKSNSEDFFFNLVSC